MPVEWTFADPENVVTFTVRQIALEGQPILSVYHDLKDGGGNSLSGARHP
jgi:hypothetical protein